jgi:hypothetical protein
MRREVGVFFQNELGEVATVVQNQIERAVGTAEKEGSAL